MKLLASIALAIAMGLAARASQIGDEFHSNIPITQAVHVPDNLATEVTHIDLDDGVWDISGQVMFYESAQQGTVFVGAAIQAGAIVPVTLDGTTLFNAAQLDHATNIVIGNALSGRAMQVVGSASIFLVGWSHEPGRPAPNCIAWGFISARKIRNNH